VTVDRAAQIGFGLAAGAVITAISLADGALALLRSFHRAEGSPLPPHDDPDTITKYTDAVLDPLRMRGDPDTRTATLIEIVAQSGPLPPAPPPGAQPPGPQPPGPVSLPASADEIARVDGLFRRLLKDDMRYLKVETLMAEGYPPELRVWYEQVRKPANGVDQASLRRAGEFFKQNVFRVVLILGTSSLLEAYACANGVKVLAQTKYLSKQTNRRLAESLQFLLYAAEPDGFATGGLAMDAALKVRLMHGAIRWLIPRRTTWLDAELGVPINGEDLLGMLMGFSGVVIRDLATLGVDQRAEDVDDFLYLWRVVGELIGAEPDLLPASLGEALALMAAIKRRQQRPTMEGRTMALALLEFHRSFLHQLEPLGVWAMRLLAGDLVCDMVGLPYSRLRDVRGSQLVFEALTTWAQSLVGHNGIDIGNDHFRAPDVPLSLRPTFDLA
jgi:hypothetical protein